jgi:hypothetical protein
MDLLCHFNTLRAMQTFFRAPEWPIACTAVGDV